MADITMCISINCPIKAGCYRFTAKPNAFRQSYCDFSARITAGILGFECDQFIKNYNITTCGEANMSRNICTNNT
jgi:hypothetical protein